MTSSLLESLPPDTILELRMAYDRLGSIRAVARETGHGREALKFLFDQVGPVYTGRTTERPTRVAKLPTRGKVSYYFLTSAQNNTMVHEGFWNNLNAYADWLTEQKRTFSSEIMVSRFSYAKTVFQRKREKANSASSLGQDENDELFYDDRIADFVSDSRVELAPSLVWCGEANILPTAIRPLSGFETYTGRKSGIFPHTKLQMESIAQMEGTGAKHNYTTGTVTLRNYLQRKEGLKAEFHHIYGALIVEVDEDGSWYVRQLSSDDDGTFYDLDRKICKGKVTEGKRVAGLNWGDIHKKSMDPEMVGINWTNEDSIMNVLRPRVQFGHDTHDWYNRNHHEIGDCHRMFERWVMGDEDVKTECLEVTKFINEVMFRPWCETVIVDSNHDSAMDKWLREANYKADHVNAVFFLERQLSKYKAIEKGDKKYHVVEDALRSLGVRDEVKFLRMDESYVICPEHGGIECGMHGHVGPDGARGAPWNLSRAGRRANTGHTHSARILDGLYVAGTCALHPKYKKGPSSWSHSHVITYENGKRAIVTCWEGKWRA